MAQSLISATDRASLADTRRASLALACAFMANNLCHAPLEDTSGCAIWNSALQGEFHRDPAESKLKQPPSDIAFLGDVLWIDEENNTSVPELSRRYWVDGREILRLVRATDIDHFRRLLVEGRQAPRQPQSDDDESTWGDYDYEDPDVPPRAVPRSALRCVDFSPVVLRETFRPFPSHIQVRNLNKEALKAGDQNIHAGARNQVPKLSSMLDEIEQNTGFNFGEQKLIFAFIIESYFFEAPAKLGLRNEGKKAYLIADLDKYQEHREFFQEEVHHVLDAAVVHSSEDDWNKAIEKIFPARGWQRGNKPTLSKCHWWRIWCSIVGWCQKKNEVGKIQEIQNEIGQRLRNNYNIRFLPLGSAERPWDTKKMTAAQKRREDIFFYPQIAEGKAAPHVVLNPNTAQSDMATLRSLDEDYDARNGRRLHLLQLADYRFQMENDRNNKEHQQQERTPSPPNPEDDADPFAGTGDNAPASPGDDLEIYDQIERWHRNLTLHDDQEHSRRYRDQIFNEVEPRNQNVVAATAGDTDGRTRYTVNRRVHMTVEQRREAIRHRTAERSDASERALDQLIEEMGGRRTSRRGGLLTPSPTQGQRQRQRNDPDERNRTGDTADNRDDEADNDGGDIDMGQADEGNTQEQTPNIDKGKGRAATPPHGENATMDSQEGQQQDDTPMIDDGQEGRPEDRGEGWTTQPIRNNKGKRRAEPLESEQQQASGSFQPQSSSTPWKGTETKKTRKHVSPNCI